MHRPTVSFPPAVIDDLIDAAPEQQQQWAQHNALTLTIDDLEALEATFAERISARHPDDPGSLLNLDYQRGQRQIKALRAFIDRAITEVTTRQAAIRQLAHHLELEDAFRRLGLELYATRRSAELGYRTDQLDYLTQQALAVNGDLQQQLLVDDRAHQRDQERARLEHDLSLDDKRVTAELERQRLGLTQPLELQKTLATLTLAAWEKQERDPTFRATFANLQELLGQASSTLANLARGTDDVGRPLPEEERQQQYEEALKIVMEVARRLIERM